MRINVYTEEIPQPSLGSPTPERFAQIVVAEYISSKTQQPMKNYGLRIFLHSAEQLHDSERDDDRSAVTFWLGEKQSNVFDFIQMLGYCAEQSNMKMWREKMALAAGQAEAAENQRQIDEARGKV